MQQVETKGLRRAFRLTIGLKIADGILEVIGGVALLFVKPSQIDSFVQTLTMHELSKDPHDVVANLLVDFASKLTIGATLYAAIYLLAHGLVKVVLASAVWREKLWAYSWMLGFLLLFIAYQCYELATEWRWTMFGLTIFDLVVLWLTWREYTIHRAQFRNKNASV